MIRTVFMPWLEVWKEKRNSKKMLVGKEKKKIFFFFLLKVPKKKNIITFLAVISLNIIYIANL